MRSRSGSHYLAYSFAVAAPAVIGLMMAGTWPLFIDHPVSIYLLAVIFCAWLGGLYPGLTSLAISLLISNYFFIEPYYSFGIPNSSNGLTMVVSSIVGIFVSFVCEFLRTEKESAEKNKQSVSQSEARLSGIIESAMDAIITLDSEQKIVVFNRAAETMFKLAAAEAIGQPVGRFIPERFRHVHAGHVHRFGETHVTTRSMRSLGGIFGLRSDGEEFPIEASISQLETKGENFYTVILRDISERKLAEEEVRAHKDRLEAIIENEPECVKIVDSMGRLTEMNPAGLAMLEVDTVEQANGRSLKAFILPEYRDSFADLHQQVMAGGTGKLEFEVLGAKGGRRWLDTHAVPLRDSEGKVHSLLGITRDITEQKRSETELLANEAKLAAAQHHAKVGSWELDLAKRTGEWSMEMFRLFDLDPEAGVPDFQEFLQLVHPDDHAIMMEAEARAMHEGGTAACEFRSNPALGPLKYFDVTMRLVLDGAGTVMHLAGTVQDITERKYLDRLMLESEERLRFATESAQIGDWDMNLRTNVARRSLLHDKCFGYSEMIPEWGYETFLAHVDAADRDRVDAAFQKAMAGNREYDEEFRTTWPDGSVHWLWTRGTFYFDESGEPYRVAGIVVDITERKDAEQEIRELNEHLERRVEERTSQLDDANKELESFSYSVSHDLRAPLRHIDGFTQLLLKREGEKLDNKSTHYLDVISGAVGKMGILIDELLSFSRTTRQELRYDSVDMNLLVKESLTILELATAGRSIVWKIQSLPTVEGDRTLLGAVVTNLLSNAIKYSRQREEAVIEIGILEKEESVVTIYVRDNGAGFDMQYYDRLFGVFQRLHREDQFEGVGIGLATVQRIVNRHGGRVWAESEVDRGATFYFTLYKSKGEKYAN